MSSYGGGGGWHDMQWFDNAKDAHAYLKARSPYGIYAKFRIKRTGPKSFWVQGRQG